MMDLRYLGISNPPHVARRGHARLAATEPGKQGIQELKASSNTSFPKSGIPKHGLPKYGLHAPVLCLLKEKSKNHLT